MIDLEEFKSLSKTDEDHVKPIVIATVDGGPDENPRFPQVINQAIHHFKHLDLDALFVATNAPGRSCFNRVERRMAPLSHQPTGVILPHDTFGSHLNESRATINKELEKRNFADAGNILAQIWSELVIDGEPVVTEYIDPQDINENSNNLTDSWTEEGYCTHVRESQYLLQITKPTDKDCCGNQRSSLRLILPTGFLPPPCPLEQSSTLKIPSPHLQNENNFCSLFVQLSLNTVIFLTRGGKGSSKSY